MQIAKVVPKVRTRGEGIFDYAIPPQILPDIKVGILVLVPFHGRKIEGIIVDIKRFSPISHLSSLISIIDPIPVVDTAHIGLARWMADYYLTDLSKTLFEMIVPPAKRILKKQSDVVLDIQKKSPNQSAKKYLIVADFKERLKFYLQAIQKTLSRGQQVIILVPDLSLIPYFTKYLKNKVAILHAAMTRTERWLEWDRIRRGDSDIVIGSNSALFAPVKNLGLVIIDQEENETYKSGQAPRYHAVLVAEELARLTAARLVMGSLTPRIETYYSATNGKYLFPKIVQAQGISIVDMNFERQVFSLPLQQKIEESLNQKQKIILVLNRKGEGSQLRCIDCNWVYQCPQCHLPLIPTNDKVACFNCEKNFNTVDQCPKCQSFQLKAMGLTTKKLEKFAHNFWPGSKIIRIEKDGAIVKKDFDIAIATNFALKFNLPKIGLVSIIDADQGLNFPDFRAAEKTFQSLYKFLRLAKEGIIQTHLPENSIVKALADLNYEKFFIEEITNRQKSQFPPFTSLIRLLYRNNDEKIADQEAQKVAKMLISHYSSLVAILGPSAPHITLKRGYYYQQIIIKFPKELPEGLKIFLKTLPKGWVLDRDPYDLI